MTSHADQLVDSILAARPELPYQSTPTGSTAGITVTTTPDGLVLVGGIAHTPTAALELSAAIAQSVTRTTSHRRR